MTNNKAVPTYILAEPPTQDVIYIAPGKGYVDLDNGSILRYEAYPGESNANIYFGISHGKDVMAWSYTMGPKSIDGLISALLAIRNALSQD